jgi:hypothetical protein
MTPAGEGKGVRQKKQPDANNTEIRKLLPALLKSYILNI